MNGSMLRYCSNGGTPLVDGNEAVEDVEPEHVGEEERGHGRAARR